MLRLLAIVALSSLLVGCGGAYIVGETYVPYTVYDYDYYGPHYYSPFYYYPY